MATDINNILDDYMKSFGKENMYMDNMSSMSKINEKNSLNVVKDLAAYQRAMAPTDIAKDRLNQLKSRLNQTLDLDNLTKAIDQKKKSVQNKGPSVNIMAIVHGHIHPYLQSIFNLKLCQNPNFRTAIKPSTTTEPVINTTL